MSNQKYQITNRTLVKVTLSSDNEYLIFKTISRDWKSGMFYIGRDELSELEWKEQVIVRDSPYIAVLRRRTHNGMVEITFYWMQCEDEIHITGRRQMVMFPWRELRDFMDRSAQESGPRKWEILSAEYPVFPRLMFLPSRSLKQVAANKKVQRKLFRFLRTHFRWPDSEVIRLYGDFTPYGFFFREQRYGGDGICGGVILHGQENMDQACYSMHT